MGALMIVVVLAVFRSIIELGRGKTNDVGHDNLDRCGVLELVGN